jgi:hypothetical protein
MITNQQLRDAFLSPQMKHYFDRKLAPLARREVDIRIEEVLKYLNMAYHCSGDIPVSKEIDDVWHYWILETQEYEKLCDKLHGGTFLHHTSSDYATYLDQDAKNRKINLRLGIAILRSYVMNYGPFEADRIRYWPLAERLMERLHWNLAELNAWLGSVASHDASQPVPAGFTAQGGVYL